jgi:2-succinyl-5-enolpyruvyl-6-hydroxy-3-cyclohexene-1-carboxylate synthase
MKSTNKSGIQLIVNACVAHGMKHVVISPGSRNAPLSIAFDYHPEVTCYVIHDERSAAFFALGIAQQLKEPVGIVCTSGSAPLNYYPAIAEAYYQCLPIVAITADRPLEWVDQGDGQTIRQHNIFEKHVRYSVQFNDEIRDSDETWYIQREISTGFSFGNGNWKGPIHINISIKEPLYNVENLNLEPLKIIRKVESKFTLSPLDSQMITEALSLPKIMVICGQMQKNESLTMELSRFASNSSVVVLVENTSNLFDEKFIHCIDRTLNAINEKDFIAFKPDLLISIGGAIVSKKIKTFLRKNKATLHWKIGNEFPYMDTFQSLSHTFETDALSFFRLINTLEFKRNSSNYGSKWKTLDYLIKDKFNQFFENLPYSDLAVFYSLIDYLPDSVQIHMGNSSVVRYCQLFDPIHTNTYWCNRGTSGIDGSSSTALGASVIKRDLTHVLITGDVSFFYDSNAFFNRYHEKNLRIILINNSGGGIFRIIPGPKESAQLEKYFEAKHHFTAKELCASFNVNYQSVSDLQELKMVLGDFLAQADQQAKLLEVFTPAEFNPVALNEFFNSFNYSSLKD